MSTLLLIAVLLGAPVTPEGPTLDTIPVVERYHPDRPSYAGCEFIPVVDELIELIEAVTFAVKAVAYSCIVGWFVMVALQVAILLGVYRRPESRGPPPIEDFTERDE